MEIKIIIESIKNIMIKNGGLKAVYFVACGGSQAAIYPGKYLLDAEAKNISVKIFNSNEFVHVMPKALNKQCLVICCSLKATKETIEAVKIANNAGATTIAMTGSNETEMAKVGKFVVTYSNGDDQIYSISNQAQVLRLGFEILHQFEDWDLYNKAIQGFNFIDEIVNNSKKANKDDFKEYAQKFETDEIFYVIGAGPLLGTAYSMVNCHFIEMQHRHAVMIHSGEYFHGPFETTDNKIAIVLLMSTGRSRPLDERVLSFLNKYAKRFLVIDAKKTFIEEKIDPQVAEYFNSVIMIPLERYFVSQLAELTGHSMDERKYMWKVDY